MIRLLTEDVLADRDKIVSVVKEFITSYTKNADVLGKTISDYLNANKDESMVEELNKILVDFAKTYVTDAKTNMANVVKNIDEITKK